MPIRHEEPGLKVWASEIDENTLDQARRTARLPIIPLHVSLMPDAHLGMGATSPSPRSPRPEGRRYRSCHETWKNPVIRFVADGVEVRFELLS